ncbi:MAG: FecR domain-containing protein [Deltaproteobacteria bacterium]|nr:FecR domain-containing protein [Deltaproteobacteria bacterium]
MLTRKTASRGSLAYRFGAVLGAVFLLMICSAFPKGAFAEEGAAVSEVGYFSKLDGKADITRAGSSTAVPVRNGDKVFVGDVVRTKAGSKAELTFNDKTVVRLAPESRIKVDEYLFNPDGGRKKASLYLFRGKVRGVVSTFKKKVIPVSMNESTFNIQTPTAIAGVRGTDLFVFYLRGTTGVVFNEGLGFVYNPRVPAQVVDIRAGQSTFILHPEAPPLPPRRALNIEFVRHTSDTTIENGEDNGANGAEDAVETVSGEGPDEGEDHGAGDNGVASLSETGSESLEGGAGEEVDSDASRGLTGLTGAEDSFEEATEYSDIKPISETSEEALGIPGAPTVTISSAPRQVTNSSTSSFEVNVSESATLEYYLDGALVYTSSSDGYDWEEIPVAEEGGHTMTVTAIDSEGLSDSATYEWFYGQRISSIYGFIDGPDTAIEITGTAALISDGNTGAWEFGIEGWPATEPDTPWAITMGGSGLADSSSVSGSSMTGYWIADMAGSYTNGLISGAADFYYLTRTSLISSGQTPGTVEIVYDPSTGSYSGSAGGEATEDRLSFVTASYSPGLLSGLMGGTSSIWSSSQSSPAPMIMIGKYFGGTAPRLWLNQNAYSRNFINSTYTTYDGGAFFGYSAMLASGPYAKGSMYSLYIDPSGNAGVLTGGLSGEVYSDIGMMKMEGTIFPAQVKADADIPYTAANLLSSLSIDNSQSYIAPSYPTISGPTADFTGSPNWGLSTSAIAGQDWGVWSLQGGGSYSSSSPVSGDYTLNFSDAGFNSSTMIAGTYGTLSAAAGNIMEGGVLGYGARQDTASSWISAGEFLGTFSPANHTWQSIQTGAWIETGRFISMTQTAEGQAALAALNIPYAEVGRANLTGTDGNLTVNMNDVVFFAYSSGLASKIWATNNISGSYTTDPVAGSSSVALSGNGLSASFSVNQWSGGNWLSSVSASGTYSGTGTLLGSSVNMSGAAAGAYSGGSFSGTGAGVVH